MKYLATPSSIFISSSSTGELSALSQSETTFVELGEYSQNMLSEDFWTPNIASSQFNDTPKYIHEAKVCPIKNQLCSQTNVCPIKNQLCSQTNVCPIKNRLKAEHWLQDWGSGQYLTFRLNIDHQTGGRLFLTFRLNTAQATRLGAGQYLTFGLNTGYKTGARAVFDLRAEHRLKDWGQDSI